MCAQSSDKTTVDTKIIHAGRTPQHHFGAVNTPVYRASTILFENYAAFKNIDFLGKTRWDKGGLSYGRKGTPITYQLEEAILNIEGGDHCLLTQSGVGAISVVLGGCLASGDHVLISDNVYGPTKMWIEHFGARYNITFDYFPPCVQAREFETYIKPNTKLVMFESPGSLTFEISDISALTYIAKQNNIISAIDNSWSAGYFFKPFQHGCDISIQAGTKYYVGHSDALFGSITCTKDVYKVLKNNLHLNGHCVDGDTAYLALRGIRTLGVRLRQHEKNALDVARYLEERPDVKQVLHPALPSFPQHDLFKRDFTGSCGLFSFTLDASLCDKVERFVDSLKLFGIGFSWGGFESLVMPCFDDNMQRHCTRNISQNDTVIRLHIGLEDPQDLINDLAHAFSVIYL